MGIWSIALMVVVAAALAVAARALWRGQPWGRWLAIGVLSTNGVGDLVAAATRERSAAIGVIIAGALILYLAGAPSVRAFFGARVVPRE